MSLGGAAWTASAVVIDEKTADQLASTKWGANAELKQALLDQSRAARNGLSLRSRISYSGFWRGLADDQYREMRGTDGAASLKASRTEGAPQVSGGSPLWLKALCSALILSMVRSNTASLGLPYGAAGLRVDIENLWLATAMEIDMDNHLRGDEEFVMDAVTKAFSGAWRCGENPPDAYLAFNNHEVAVEVSTVMQSRFDGRGGTVAIVGRDAACAAGKGT